MIIGFGVSYAFAASGWQDPTQSPPGGNTPAPVNVGTVDQIKEAGLSLDKLAVFGQVVIQDGTQGVGKVLTSDTNGIAAWKTLEEILPTCSEGQTIVKSEDTWACGSAGISQATSEYRVTISGPSSIVFVVKNIYLPVEFEQMNYSLANGTRTYDYKVFADNISLLAFEQATGGRPTPSSGHFLVQKKDSMTGSFHDVGSATLNLGNNSAYRMVFLN